MCIIQVLNNRVHLQDFIPVVGSVILSPNRANVTARGADAPACDESPAFAVVHMGSVTYSSKSLEICSGVGRSLRSSLGTDVTIL